MMSDKTPANNDNLLSTDNLLSLVNYRELQAKELSERLDTLQKLTIKKYGSYDKIAKQGLEPLESESDYTLIKRIADNKNFVIIPIFNESGISRVYTIGLWYYWGLPEIVLTFEKPIKSNPEFTHVLMNILHDHLYSMYKNKIVKQDDNKQINRLEYKNENSIIKLDLVEYNIELELYRIKEEDYMELKAGLMLWFYMYYMEAEVDENNVLKMYPVYQIKMDEQNYNSVMKKITDKLVDVAIEKLGDISINDIDTDSEISSVSSLSDDLDPDFHDLDDMLRKAEKNGLQKIKDMHENLDGLDDSDNEDSESENEQEKQVPYKIKFCNVPH